MMAEPFLFSKINMNKYSKRHVRVTFQGEINFNYIHIESSHNTVYSNGIITLRYDEKKRTFCYGKTKILPPVVLHRL